MLCASFQLCLPPPSLENTQKCNCNDSCPQNTNLGHGLTLWLNQMCALPCWKGALLLSLNSTSLLPCSIPPSPLPRLPPGFWYASSWKVNCCNLLTKKNNKPNKQKNRIFFFHWVRLKSALVRPDKCLCQTSSRSRGKKEEKAPFQQYQDVNSLLVTLSNHTLISWI